MPYPSEPVGQIVAGAWRQTLANGGIGPIGAYALEAGKPRQCWLRRGWPVLCALLLALSAGCSRTPPEQALRESVAAMQAAAESGQGDALMDRVAEDFVGPGGMDRDMLRRYVAASLLRHRKIGIVLGPLDLKLQGERATVGFTAATSGGEGWWPESGRVYNVRTGWRREGEDWRLVSAQWD